MLFLQAPIAITVDATNPTVTVPKSLYGVFFEEINHAGEGGLYAEKLPNRSLVGPPGPKTGLPEGWRGEGDVKLMVKLMPPMQGMLDGIGKPYLQAAQKDGVPAAIVNDGFWGIALRKGETYKLRLRMASTAPVEFRLTGAETARTSRPISSLEQDVIVTFVAQTDEPKASLTITPTADGLVVLSYASLMPEATWKNRKNGMRPDLARKVAAMDPGFVRFPGGCYVEGNDLPQAWNWKKTLGPNATRPGSESTLWGYPSSDGLGFHEYLQWCEDLKSDPLFVANVGISHTQIEPIATMGKWVQDALDAIEYANGPVTSKWGALRAKAGHPKPFGLKYVEIGNENGAGWSYGGPEAYAPRYRLMYDAIKACYPNIVTIADNPVPHPMDVLDEHYYASADWFWREQYRYDSYKRTGPKIYVGEYAVTQNAGRGNLDAALGEAAFMTGMERNSDIVTMSSYAPLLVNENSRQWNPNAIVFDAARSYGTPSYWVQALFAQNRPSRILPATFDAAKAPAAMPAGNVGLLTWNTQAEFRDVRLELDGKPVPLTGDAAKPTGEWRRDGEVISQSAPGENRRYVFPTATLNGAKRAVLTLKARKLGGDEGFIILFGNLPGDMNDSGRIQWNLGGWRNVKHAFQVNGGITGPEVPGKIETGRDYDIRLEREGDHIRGFLDGKLVQEFDIPVVPDFAAVAGRDDRTGDVILKLVNGSAEPRDTALNFTGFVAKSGTVTVLTAPTLDAENSFDAPDRIAPTTTRLEGPAALTLYRMPPYSLSILRLKKS